MTNEQDTREKLLKDIMRDSEMTFSMLNVAQTVTADYSAVLEWLDRQAAITERETVKQWEEQASELACHVNELQAERDEWRAKFTAAIGAIEEPSGWREENRELYLKVDRLEAERDELMLKLAGKPKCEVCDRTTMLTEIEGLTAERDELRERLRIECEAVEACEGCDKVDSLQAELDKANESGGKLFDKLIDTTAERDRLLEQLQRVWLKDADGNPLHIGETRYGKDGIGWRVTGFRWGSSHPVQGVDGKGRRRDLKPEWLRSEKPDTWEFVRSELGHLMANLSIYGSKYAGDPYAELDAILERARGLEGGSE